MAVGVTLFAHPPSWNCSTPHSSLPGMEKVDRMGNWKWELYCGGVIEGWLYSSDV